MEHTPPHNQDQELLKLLKSLQSERVEYPRELLAARRADFIATLKQYNRVETQAKASAAPRQFTKRLKELQSGRAEYPPELLAARRAAFVAQVEQLGVAEVVEDLTARDHEFLRLLQNVRSEETGYPPRLLAARRAAFVRQVRLGGRVSLLDAWRLSFHLFLRRMQVSSTTFSDAIRTSAVIAMLVLAAFVGSLFRVTPAILQTSQGQEQSAQMVPVSTTTTGEVPSIICRSGYEPPLCLAEKFDQSQDLTYQGNGVARPAVAKDTLPAHEGIHDPANVNDGLYGPGSSWVSESPYSWIKIDLGKPTTINTVAFGRDRLGHLKDGNPGQFVIAVALSDNVYADGNSSNDYVEYTQIYHSQRDGFKGVVRDTETIWANFVPVKARYIKIIFANPGTAVDEVEAFLVSPAVVAQNPTRKPQDEESIVPTIAWTAAPTNTTAPTDTASPVPTDTPALIDTTTPVPTNTPQPTDTPTPEPTDTPPPTRTPIPEPTDTPAPSHTPVPAGTPAPIMTDTAEPVVEFIETVTFVGGP